MGQSLWALGAVINVLGSVFINLGTNIMKLGHNKRDMSPLPEEDRPPIRKYKEWQLGIGLFALGNVLNFISFGFAAQSLLAALGSVQFISNVVFAHFVLQEKVTKKILGGTGLIVLGCILLVSFGNHTSEILTVHDMIADFKSTPYIVYLVLLVLNIAGMYATYRVGKRHLRLVGHERLSGWWVRMLPISYALFSGMLGTQSVLFCKMLSMLLRTTIQGDSQLGSWFTWVIFVLFLGTAFFWVSRLNKALKQFPAIMIVPTMQISWTLFSILGGGVYFQEYKTFTVLSASMFALGVVVVFIGVFMLTPSKRAYLRHYKDLEDKRAMMKFDNDDGNGHDPVDVEDGYAGDELGKEKLNDTKSSSVGLGKENGRGSGGDVEQGVTKRGTAPGRSVQQELRSSFDRRKLAPVRVKSPPTSVDAKRSSSTGERWIDVAMSPLSTKDEGEIRPATGEDPALASIDVSNSLLEDLKEDFSMDVNDNYKRMLGLESEGQLPAISVLGMPFDCFLDDFARGSTGRTVEPWSNIMPAASQNVTSTDPHTSRGEPGHAIVKLQAVSATGPGPPRSSASDPGEAPRLGAQQGGLLSLHLGALHEDPSSPGALGYRGSLQLDSAALSSREAGIASNLSSPWMSPTSSAGLASPPESGGGSGGPSSSTTSGLGTTAKGLSSHPN